MESLPLRPLFFRKGVCGAPWRSPLRPLGGHRKVLLFQKAPCASAWSRMMGKSPPFLTCRQGIPRKALRVCQEVGNCTQKVRERPSQTLGTALRGPPDGLLASSERCLHMAGRPRRRGLSEELTTRGLSDEAPVGSPPPSARPASGLVLFPVTMKMSVIHFALSPVCSTFAPKMKKQ